MSTAIARNFQIGIDPTPTNNFTLYQPTTPDGTLRLGNGNTGITSSLLTLTSAGDLGIGTSSPANKLNVFGSDATVRTESTSEDKGLLLVKSGVQGFAVTVNGAAQRLDFSGANAWPSISQIMSLTASGNVGIGTTSPAKRLDVDGQLRVRNGGATGYALIEYGASATATNNWHVGSEGDGSFRWYNGNFGAGSERMRIDSSGRLLIAGTTASYSSGFFQLNSGKAIIRSTDSGYGQFQIGNPDSGGEASIGFVSGATGFGDPTSVNGNNNIWAIGANVFGIGGSSWGIGNKGAAAAVARIAWNSTSWTFASDERLKNLDGEITDALQKVSSLRPVYFTWKNDEAKARKVGLIAQDVLAVLPEAVSVPEQEFREDGSPNYLGLGMSDVVPLLVAAIQELKAEFDAYKATHP